MVDGEYSWISIGDAVQRVLAGLGCGHPGGDVIFLDTWKRAHAPGPQNSAPRESQAPVQTELVVEEAHASPARDRARNSLDTASISAARS